MTAEGWNALVRLAVHQHDSGDDDLLDLLTRLLVEQDAAKNELRRKGYGVTGTPWAETVAEIPEAG